MVTINVNHHFFMPLFHFLVVNKNIWFRGTFGGLWRTLEVLDTSETSNTLETLETETSETLETSETSETS